MCKKKKHDKLGAMFALSQCKRVGNYNSLRNERRYYYLWEESETNKNSWGKTK